MNNKQRIAGYMKMNLKELFAVVMDEPELLTDGYYRELGNAIRARYQELLKEERMVMPGGRRG